MYSVEQLAAHGEQKDVKVTRRQNAKAVVRELGPATGMWTPVMSSRKSGRSAKGAPGAVE
jgi:hypothetical protein